MPGFLQYRVLRENDVRRYSDFLLRTLLMRGSIAFSICHTFEFCPFDYDYNYDYDSDLDYVQPTSGLHINVGTTCIDTEACKRYDRSDEPCKNLCKSHFCLQDGKSDEGDGCCGRCYCKETE